MTYGFYLSPIGLNRRRQGKGPLSESRVLVSRSTLLNLVLVRLRLTQPRLPLLQDRTVGLVVQVPIENIKWLYTQTRTLSSLHFKA